MRSSFSAWQGCLDCLFKSMDGEGLDQCHGQISKSKEPTLLS